MNRVTWTQSINKQGHNLSINRDTMALYDLNGKKIAGTDDSVIQVPKQLVTEINTRTLARKAIDEAFINHKRTCMLGRRGHPCDHVTVMVTMENEAIRLGQELHVLMAKLLMTLGIESGQPDEPQPTNLMEMPTKPGSDPS